MAYPSVLERYYTERQTECTTYVCEHVNGLRVVRLAEGHPALAAGPPARIEYAKPLLDAVPLPEDGSGGAGRRRASPRRCPSPPRGEGGARSWGDARTRTRVCRRICMRVRVCVRLEREGLGWVWDVVPGGGQPPRLGSQSVSPGQ